MLTDSNLSSLLDRSLKYIITTGEPRLLFTDIDIGDHITTNDVPPEGCIQEVTIKDPDTWDLLLEFLPYLSTPNLVIHRATFATIFSKSTQGVDPLSNEYSKGYKNGFVYKTDTDEYLKYVCYPCDDNVIRVKGLDRNNQLIMFEFKNKVVTGEPVLVCPISEYYATWYSSRVPRLTPEDKIIHRQDFTVNSLVQKYWYMVPLGDTGLSYPYCDGRFGVGLISYMKKKKDFDTPVHLTIKQVGTTGKIVTTCTTDIYDICGGPINLQYFLSKEMVK